MPGPFYIHMSSHILEFKVMSNSLEKASGVNMIMCATTAHRLHSVHNQSKNLTNENRVLNELFKGLRFPDRRWEKVGYYFLQVLNLSIPILLIEITR